MKEGRSKEARYATVARRADNQNDCAKDVGKKVLSPRRSIKRRKKRRANRFEQRGEPGSLPDFEKEIREEGFKMRALQASTRWGELRKGKSWLANARKKKGTNFGGFVVRSEPQDTNQFWQPFSCVFRKGGSRPKRRGPWRDSEKKSNAKSLRSLHSGRNIKQGGRKREKNESTASENEAKEMGEKTLVGWEGSLEKSYGR